MCVKIFEMHCYFYTVVNGKNAHMVEILFHVAYDQ